MEKRTTRFNMIIALIPVLLLGLFLAFRLHKIAVKPHVDEIWRRNVKPGL